MDIEINEVQEIIKNLESGGELSIKEEKYLKIAKLCVQLAAENVGLKAAFNKPDAWLSFHSIPPTYQEPDRGGEYLAVHEQPGEKNDDGSDSWPVYAKPEIETPATDAYLAGIKADAITASLDACSDYLETDCVMDRLDISYEEAEKRTSGAIEFHDAMVDFANQLREGADK